MKKIVMTSLGLMFLLPFTPLEGAEISVSSGQTSFGVEVTTINKILSTGATQFNFEPVNIKNNASIDHWKIRVYCEDAIIIRVNGLTENSCGKAVQVANTANNKFFVSMMNPTGKTTGFSFKLKAYDKNGRWLHSEKESFRWK